MKRFSLLLGAALLGFAVSAPAQFADNGAVRKSRGTVATSQQSQRGQIVNRSRSARSASRATNPTRSSSRQASRSSQRGVRSSRNNNNSSRTVRSSGVTRRSQSVVRSNQVRSSQARSSRGNRLARNLGRIARSLPAPRINIGFGNRYNRSCGHWETVYEEVLVPGYWDVQHHPAVYGWVYNACGNRVWGVIEPARDCRVWVPARYETRSRQVWVRH